jgi:acyl-CoA thioesterase-1
MVRAFGVLSLVVVLAACASEDRGSAAPPGAPPGGPKGPHYTEEPAAVAAAPSASRPRIVALGDSLTAGLGLAPDQAYPALLQKRVDAAGLNYEVVNAGVSGDTSAGGLRRIDWALEGDVKVLIVALGGNDALRGLPVEQLRQNLTTIVERARARHITVILAGMEAPPNFGAAYTTAFRQSYREVAAQHGAVLIPFLLDGVAGLPDMNQGDGIHPTAAGAEKVADTVWSALRPIVKPE